MYSGAYGLNWITVLDHVARLRYGLSRRPALDAFPTANVNIALYVILTRFLVTSAQN